MRQARHSVYDPGRFPNRPLVAIVDDDARVRAVLARALQICGLDVVEYPDGAEALIGALDRRPDLLLIDKCMPRLDGISLTRALRDEAATQRVPILLMSANAMEEDVVAGLDAGADDFVTKPFSLSVLRAKVRRFLGRSPAPAQLPEAFALPENLGDYVLEELIGSGGSGEVFRAYQAGARRTVALKLLYQQEGFDRDALARFFREIAVLASLDLPHVVRFYDSGYARGRYFFTMEHVQGSSAKQRLLLLGPWGEREAFKVGVDVVRALAGLAEHGMVHRDVKPGNILVDPRGHATLVDFGLAKTEGQNDLTGSDVLMGTAGYLAPEVVAGEPETLASDFYALGVSLYQLIGGNLPHKGETPLDVLRRVHEGLPAAPLSEYRPDVDAGAEEVIAQLMRPDPAERLADPLQAERALLQVLADL